MNRRRFVIGAGAALAAAAGGVQAWRGYRGALDPAWARVSSGSRTIKLPSGRMEWAEAGSGPPLLMLHGTGGGFDQGLAFARRLSDDGWRVIAPSRFGYLRTDFPADASSGAEADAMAGLLDALGIDRLPVIGGSAGALPALQFAIRHPDRCAALTAIVPATFVPGRPAPQPAGALAKAIIAYGLRSDVLFWLGTALAPDSMIRTLLATDPALVHAAEPQERARVLSILRGILPVSARTRGILNDGRLAGDPQEMDLGRITAPTLAVSCEDDLFGTAAAARHIAASVPGAGLLMFPTGGHVWVGHDAALFEAVGGFLRKA